MKDSTRHTLIALIFGLAGLVMLIWFLYGLVQTSPAFQSGVIAFIGVVTAGIISHRYTSKRDIAARHFEKKREAYTAFIDLVFEMLPTHGEHRKLARQDIAQRMLQYKKHLLTWADADVIKTWKQIERGLPEDLDEALVLFDKLLRTMRKDLGMNDSELAPRELVDLLLSPKERRT